MRVREGWESGWDSSGCYASVFEIRRERIGKKKILWTTTPLAGSLAVSLTLAVLLVVSSLYLR